MNQTQVTDAKAQTPQRIPQPTVGDCFDQEIANARLRLENLCVAKAKADTLGMLNHPAIDIRNILGWVI